MGEIKRVPTVCPCCDGELLLTRLTCRSCGTELSGEFGTCGCHEESAQAGTDTTESEDATSSGSPLDSGSPSRGAFSAQAQILARVASGDLDPGTAADLLRRLG